MKIALASGGKDSLYAAYKEWPIDLYLFLVYEFPVLSPHIINMRASIATLLTTGRPVVIFKVPKRDPLTHTSKLLSMFNVSQIIAGDIYIEDHLKYMENLANLSGAVLREPLWGEDPKELVYKIVEEGFVSKVIGVMSKIRPLLGRVFSSETVDEIVELLDKAGVDAMGENGEYHTLILDSPLHQTRVDIFIKEVIEDGDNVYLAVEPRGNPWLPSLHPTHTEPRTNDEEKDANS